MPKSRSKKVHIEYIMRKYKKHTRTILCNLVRHFFQIFCPHESCAVTFLKAKYDCLAIKFLNTNSVFNLNYPRYFSKPQISFQDATKILQIEDFAIFFVNLINSGRAEAS